MNDGDTNFNLIDLNKSVCKCKKELGNKKTKKQKKRKKNKQQ